MKHLTSEKIREALVIAIGIMDDKGRANVGDTSIMLWHSEWNSLRYILLKLVDPAIEEGIDIV